MPSAIRHMPSGIRHPLSAIFPGLVFLASALIGVWAAYDRGVAWGRFWLLALGVVLTVGIAWAGQRAGEPAQGVVGLGCALLAAGVGAYFLLEYDWATRGPGPFAMLQQAGLWIQAHRPAVPLPEDIHRNVAGGALAITLPLGWGGVQWAWQRHQRLPATVGALALLLGLATLVLTASRGAWIGLAAGAVTAAGLHWRGYARLRNLPPWSGNALAGGVALLLLAGFWAAIALPGLDRFLGAVPAGQSAVSRVALWRNMLSLVRDYPFTGSGLGSTPMVYSTYALLLHVPFITHAHNLFLQMAVQQGLPALGAFLWLIGLAIRALVGPFPTSPPRLGGTEGGLRTAGIASLVVLVVHGMGDAGLYVSRLVAVVFLPIGLALAFAAGGAVGRPAPAEMRGRGRRVSIHWQVVVILALGALLLPGSRAAFQANLGAVAQTRAELAAYGGPEWPLQDALRRPVVSGTNGSPAIDLAPAIARYQAALALKPRNVTANRRLGQIELSAGQYAAARQHLEAAYAAAPHQPAIGQLLGESYAVAGDVETAAALWRPLDLSQGQLNLRRWWYVQIGEPERAAWIAEAAELADGG